MQDKQLFLFLAIKTNASVSGSLQNNYLCTCMTNYYKVAGHEFGVSIPDGNPLCGQLSQYEPFRIEKGENCIFEVEVVDKVDDPADKEVVYAGPEDPEQPLVKLYKSGEKWIYEMAVCSGRPLAARMESNAAFTRGRVETLSEKGALFGLNNALMLMFAFRTAGMNTLEMHASVIVNGGKAFLWLAASGTGKSTHSKLWLKHIPGSRLLNDDNPIVRIMDDGCVEVFGSPWSGKTPCYRNEHYPLGAFTRIRRASFNKISRLSNFEAYALLYSSSSGFKTDPAMGDALHATFEQLVMKCPCYVLDCLPDEEAARVSSAELLSIKD